MEIIGVVGNVKYLGLDNENTPVYYELSAQVPSRPMWLLVRTKGDAQSLASAVRGEIRNLDPTCLSIASARWPRRFLSPLPCRASARS